MPGDLVGSWSGQTGSCVAIGPEHVILTKHQGGGVGTSVGLAGRSYRVESVWSHESLDLRVARIAPVEASGVLVQNWARVSYGPAETGKTVAIGGWGRTAGSTLTAQGVPYAYQWTPTGGELTWGVNVVDSTYGLVGSGSDAGYMYVSFDDVGEGNYRPGEIGLATGDSGGGWFLQDEKGRWVAVGLSLSVDHVGTTYFRQPETLLPDPDRSYALRLGPLASWIRAILNGTALPGDADSDGSVDFADFVAVSRHFGMEESDWAHGDFDGNGRTDGADLQILRTNYGRREALEEAVTPEPSSIVILLAGGALGNLLPRSRRPICH
jgi:hypothetical protein